MLTYPVAGGGHAAVWVADRWCPPRSNLSHRRPHKAQLHARSCNQQWCRCLLDASYVWLHVAIDAKVQVAWSDGWAPVRPDWSALRLPRPEPARAARTVEQRHTT